MSTLVCPWNKGRHSLFYIISRAKLVGQRLYYGALLTPPSKHTKTVNEEDMKKFSSSLPSELTYALMNNYSYKEYCQLEKSLIPQWLEEKEEKKGSEWVNEDLFWLQISEKELNEVLHAEEANLRDEDITAIISTALISKLMCR